MSDNIADRDRVRDPVVGEVEVDQLLRWESVLEEGVGDLLQKYRLPYLPGAEDELGSTIPVSEEAGDQLSVKVTTSREGRRNPGTGITKPWAVNSQQIGNHRDA